MSTLGEVIGQVRAVLHQLEHARQCLVQPANVIEESRQLLVQALCGSVESAAQQTIAALSEAQDAVTEACRAVERGASTVQSY